MELHEWLWVHFHGIDDKIVDLPPQLTEDTSGLESDESAPQQHGALVVLLTPGVPVRQHQLIA